MASLDVLDYQVGLERALAQRGDDGQPLLDRRLRRQAIKDARRLVDAMAFRFAILDERPLPEDLDYLRALEAVKNPEKAAPVLARRAPQYQKVRRRRLITTYFSLAIVALFLTGIVYAATYEDATELALINHRTAEPITFSANQTFLVSPEMTRLHIDGTIIPPARDSPGVVEVRLVDPEGNVAFYEAYGPGANNWLRHNVYAPQAGEWTLLVDFLEAEAAARVSVDGIYPAR